MNGNGRQARAPAFLFAAWVVAALLRTPPAFAFTLERVDNNPCNTGARNLSWASRAATVDAARIASPFRTHVDTARSRWNESVPTFRFAAGGGGDFCNSGDGVVTLAFSPTACDGAPMRDALAITRLRWEVGSGALLDADVVFSSEFEASNSTSSQQVFLEVALHELGHVLGLDHSDACGASGAGTLMRSQLFFNASRLDRPQDDDIAGARAVYPPGGTEPLPDGANSCAVVASETSAWPLALPALLRFFRRRRSPRIP